MKKRVFSVIFLFTVVLNAAAILLEGFADWYTLRIFPLWVNTLGRLTSIFPFSVGEFMIIIGVLWLVVLAVSAILIFDAKKEPRIRKFAVSFAKATPPLLVIIFLIMSLNCFINYRTTPIIESEGSGREYTVSELAELRDYIVTRCNELAEKVERDENGRVLIQAGDSSENQLEQQSGTSTEDYMEQQAKRAMSALSDRFPKLGGFYVTPKPMLFSGFVSQQNMMGYFFPFSMEANYNIIMYDMNKPFTMCHELAHTKSYIMEDEANFLAYLACTGSDDVIFQYSGYLEVLNYVNNAFYKNVSKEEYKKHVAISENVKKDNIFLTEEAHKKVEDNAVISTETVRKAADTFVDTTLKVNGIDDGIASYSRVVELILMDYFEK